MARIVMPRSAETLERLRKKLDREPTNDSLRNTYDPGDVFRINDQMPPDRAGWIGAFVLATDIKGWGIEGEIHMLLTPSTSSVAPTRLYWDQVEFVGTNPIDLVRQPAPE